jgi:hypothetical protein
MIVHITVGLYIGANERKLAGYSSSDMLQFRRT